MTIALDRLRLADEADAFARSLADVVAAEPALRYQGMPSDGDSRAVYEALGRGRLDRHPLAAGARRARPELAGHARLRGALRLPLAAAVGLPAVGQDDRQRAAALRRPPSCSSGSSPRWPPAGCSSARASPSPTRAPISPRCAPGRSLDGERFVVNGRKIWTSSADYADWVYLAVRTDPDRERHRGISVLVAADRHARDHRAAPTARSAAGRSASCELERRRDPRRPAGRRAARRLAGADGDARLRAGDQREGRHRVLAARRAASRSPTTAGRARQLRRLRGAAQAARLHGRRAAELLAGRAGRPASRARWPSCRWPS